jgi:hypothetical protein
MSLIALSTSTPAEDYERLKYNARRLRTFCDQRAGNYSNPDVSRVLNDINTLIAFRDTLTTDAAKDIDLQARTTDGALYDVVSEANDLIALVTTAIQTLVTTIPQDRGNVLRETITSDGVRTEAKIADTTAAQAALQAIVDAII